MFTKRRISEDRAQGVSDYLCPCRVLPPQRPSTLAPRCWSPSRRTGAVLYSARSRLSFCQSRRGSTRPHFFDVRRVSPPNPTLGTCSNKPLIPARYINRNGAPPPRGSGSGAARNGPGGDAASVSMTRALRSFAGPWAEIGPAHGPSHPRHKHFRSI